MTLFCKGWNCGTIIVFDAGSMDIELNQVQVTKHAADKA